MKVHSKTYPKITSSKKERIVRVPCNVEEVIRDEEIHYRYDESILPDDGHTMDEQLLLMRKIEWPEARLNIDYIINKGQGELQAFEEWISDGAMLRDEEGQYTGQATKVEWKGTHPKPSRIMDGEKLSEATLKEFTSATTIKDLKIVLKKVFRGG